MGCSYDTAHVWSANEASPEACTEDEPEPSITSYTSCWEFVDAFQRLYNARNQIIFPRENPMLVNSEQGASSDFANLQFPVAFEWAGPGENLHGIRNYTGYLHDEGVSEETGLFCGAKLGPPTALTRACDKSLKFLLGEPASTGMLSATVEAVEGKSQKHQTLITSA
ncbi:hypothetical protein ACHAWF_016104 [Thalassiosira exigua]